MGDPGAGSDPTLNALVEALLTLVTEEEDWRDWAGGVPADVLAKVAATLVAQTEAGWAAELKMRNPTYWTEEKIQKEMAEWKGKGPPGRGLFVFARVCKEWRKAQLKVGGPLRTRVRSDVIAPGSVALAKWALAEGCPRETGWGWSMADSAAEYGHLEMMKWLCGEGGFATYQRMVWKGAGSGSLQLVQWLIEEKGLALNEDVMASAAGSGNFGLVQWLRGEGCEWDKNTCSRAARSGNLGLLQWLLASGCPSADGEICASAAYSGHLETLRWARENGCEWDEEACARAAHYERLEILQWLRANGCPWDESTTEEAAEGGELETLRWAHENGCPWSEDTCATAAYSGNLVILQWLRENDCPWDAETCRCAVDFEDVEVLRWARENGCPWTAATRDEADMWLGYTDDLGNLVEEVSDDEYDYSDEYSYEDSEE